MSEPTTRNDLPIDDRFQLTLDNGIAETGYFRGHNERRLAYERAERQRLIRGKAGRCRLYKWTADDVEFVRMGMERLSARSKAHAEQHAVAKRPSLWARPWRWVRGWFKGDV